MGKTALEAGTDQQGQLPAGETDDQLDAAGAEGKPVTPETGDEADDGSGDTPTPGEGGETGEEGDGGTPEEEDGVTRAIKKAKAGTPDPVQRRIDRAIRRQRDAEEEALYWRGKAEAYEQGKPGQMPAAPGAGADAPAPWERESAADPKPVLDNYASEADYHADLGRWAAREEIRKHQSTERQSIERNKQQAQQRAEAARKDAIIETGRELFDDFDDITDAKNLKLTPAMVSAIINLDPEIGAQTIYALGADPKLVKKIAGIENPIGQIREILAIESRLRSKRQSNAPEPITPLNGGKAPTRDYSDPSISTSDRIAQARARRAKQRR